MRTTVVNVRTALACDVYGGRGSPLGNPYQLGVDGDRAEVIRLYRTHFEAMLARDPSFKAFVESCRGKAIGCHCAPLACHLDIVVEYLEKAWPATTEPR